ncbi:Na+/H+ antiporter subunit C [Sphingobacterium corticis]|uniref:Na+/H+ antiporter subunit C n=1 Tax=Sphingobacterium corticis TaxID=1812823 RepID=A0ABW5NNW2_9SPHI
MELILVLVLGLMYAAGVYLILRRSMIKLLLGIMMMGNGTNILIFLIGSITKGQPPVIDAHHNIFQDIYADPIPQALILTAIVISFALSAFAIVLLKRAYALLQKDDLDDLNTPEEEDI